MIAKHFPKSLDPQQEGSRPSQSKFSVWFGTPIPSSYLCPRSYCERTDTENGRVILLWGSGYCQRGCSCPSGWPHTRVQTGSTSRRRFAKSNNDDDNKKNMTLVGVREDKVKPQNWTTSWVERKAYR